MNLPINSAPTQLPAHLQEFAGFAQFGEDAVGGISVGKAHPRVSIKQNRFRLINEQGQEYVVPALHLDVIVVGVNKFVSKIYYDKKFNPQDPEPPAPACFSDNGVGPSVRSANPQCGTCAACPHNVWGSKVTDAGTKVKACADNKKFAVVLADNPGGLVYELRVPAASMENVKGLVDMLNERKTPLPSIVIRLTFDEQSQYPKLIFTPVNYINEQQKSAVLEVLDGEEAAECVGKDDKAIDAGLVNSRAQPLPSPAKNVEVPPVVNSPFVPSQAPAPQPQQFTPPPAANPAPMAAPVFSEQTPPPKRRRNAKAAAVETPPETVAQSPITPVSQQPRTFDPSVPPGIPAAGAPHPVDPNFQQAQPVQMAANAALEIPAFLRRDTPGATPAAAATNVAPQATDPALDAIIGDAFR